MGRRRGNSGPAGSSGTPSSVPFWHTFTSSPSMSISNRYPKSHSSPLISPARACPTLAAAAPLAPGHRRAQKHVSAIIRLLASSSTLRASFTINGHSDDRFASSGGGCFTPLFMQPQPLFSIPFPRAEPRFTIQRPGQSPRPQSSPRHSWPATALEIHFASARV